MAQTGSRCVRCPTEHSHHLRSTFGKLCAAKPCAVKPCQHDDGIVTIGDLGLGLSLDESRQPVVSVETAALYELVQTPGAKEDVPEWLAQLQSEWTSGMCTFMFNTQTGWRGCFAEHRRARSCAFSAAKAVEGAPLATEGVHDIHGLREASTSRVRV